MQDKELKEGFVLLAVPMEVIAGDYGRAGIRVYGGGRKNDGSRGRPYG